MHSPLWTKSAGASSAIAKFHPGHRLPNAYDQDLKRRVVNYLVGHKMPALRHVDVEADRGTVVLRGRVYSFFQKQLCLNCCRRVAGVIKLVDKLDVVTESE
jgi:osmotically-inducible protein OsmY